MPVHSYLVGWCPHHIALDPGEIMTGNGVMTSFSQCIDHKGKYYVYSK